jgi:hypothetical protein
VRVRSPTVREGNQRKRKMKLLRFTFKREAIWMMIFSVAPAIIALLVILIVLFARR